MSRNTRMPASSVAPRPESAQNEMPVGPTAEELSAKADALDASKNAKPQEAVAPALTMADLLAKVDAVSPKFHAYASAFGDADSLPIVRKVAKIIAALDPSDPDDLDLINANKAKADAAKAASLAQADATMSALINELNLVAVALGLPKSLKWADTVKVVRKTGDGDSGKTGEGGKTVWTIASLDMPKLADKGKEYQAKAEELLASKAEFTTGKELARAIGFDVDKPTEGQISWPDRMSKFGIIAKKHELAA